MLDKIKDLMRIQEEVTNLSNKFDANSKLVTELNSNIISLKTEIDSLKDSQKQLVASLQSDSKSISEAKEEFRKEINDFKLLKSRLEQKLVTSFEEELKKDLIPKLDRLERTAKEFEELSGRIEIISKRVINLSSEIQKFSEIGQNIRKEDFELTRFVHQLKALDNEKLELLRKIDTLERLVGQMRRRSVQARHI